MGILDTLAFRSSSPDNFFAHTWFYLAAQLASGLDSCDFGTEVLWAVLSNLIYDQIDLKNLNTSYHCRMLGRVNQANENDDHQDSG